MKRFARPETALFLGLWLVLLIGGQSRFLRDPGTFWHVAVGQRLLSDGFFAHDPYSFTFARHLWIPQQWLGEGLMYVVYWVLGLDGLLMLAVTLIAALFTGIGIRLLRCGLHLSVVCVLVACGLLVSATHFHIRPHLATFVGLAISMVYLTDVEARRLTLRRLWWLVPVFWLWANVHGGVVGGLATFAFVGTGWFLAWVLRRESPLGSWRDVGQVALVFLSCTLACFANPYGWRLPEAWLTIYRLQTLPLFVEEHAPLQVEQLSGMVVVGFALLYAGLLWGVCCRKMRVTWLLPFVWLVLAYLRIRHAPLFAIVALLAVADFFPFTRYAERLQRRQSDWFTPPESDRDPPSPRETARGFVIPLALVAGSALVQLAGWPIPVVGRGWATPDPATGPMEMLPELHAHERLRPTGTRIFNECHYGGFLIQQTPGYRVFIDDRFELYGDAFLADFLAAQYMLTHGFYQDPGLWFDDWQKRYGTFDLALVDHAGAFDRAFAAMPGDWEVVQRTASAVLYRRRD